MHELGLLIKLTDAETIGNMLQRVVDFGFSTCQLSTYVPELYTQENADFINGFCDKNKLKITMMWAGWPGNCEWNFTGGPTTVGLVPMEYREERKDIIKKGSDFARLLGVEYVASHAGFIPENMSDPSYPLLVEALKEIALHCRENGQVFCFETGQETPITLLRTMEDIGLDNVGVNLDPANLIMYGKGNAVDSIKILGPYIKGIHVKDGLYPTNGRELGIEVPIGQGDVDMPRFIAKIKDTGYTGPYTIEIELDRRQAESTPERAIEEAVSYLKKLI